jgi:hypothetical protein
MTGSSESFRIPQAIKRYNTNTSRAFIRVSDILDVIAVTMLEPSS